jgi:hypothetical protein
MWIIERTFEIDSIAQERFSILPKIAILMYWAAALQHLYSQFFPHKMTGNSIPIHTDSHTMPTSLLIGVLVFALALGALKLPLSFRLSRRKNWARIVVVVIASAQAVFLIPGTIAMTHVSQQAFFVLLINSWGLYAEIVAAVLLLLPQSWGWFAPSRASD